MLKAMTILLFLTCYTLQSSEIIEESDKVYLDISDILVFNDNIWVRHNNGWAPSNGLYADQNGFYIQPVMTRPEPERWYDYWICKRCRSRNNYRRLQCFHCTWERIDLKTGRYIDVENITSECPVEYTPH